MKSGKTIQKGVYKGNEFDAFIKTLKWGSAAHWIEIANALGVDKNTIVEWKKLPEAQAAIQEGIDQALAAMQQAGAKDWHMWEAKLKMLGINPASKLDVEINDPRGKILDKYLGDDKGVGKTQETESRPSADTT